MKETDDLEVLFRYGRMDSIELDLEEEWMVRTGFM
jgi:hypothetical protein